MRTKTLSDEQKKENYNSYMREYYRKRKEKEKYRNLKINTILEAENSKNSTNSNTIHLLKKQLDEKDSEIKQYADVVTRLKLYIIDNLP